MAENKQVDVIKETFGRSIVSEVYLKTIFDLQVKILAKLEERSEEDVRKEAVKILKGRANQVNENITGTKIDWENHDL